MKAWHPIVFLLSTAPFACAAVTAVNITPVPRAGGVYEGASYDLDADGMADFETAANYLGHEYASYLYWGASPRSGVAFLKSTQTGFGDQTSILPLSGAVTVGADPSQGSWYQGATPAALLVGAMPSVFYQWVIEAGTLNLNPPVAGLDGAVIDLPQNPSASARLVEVRIPGGFGGEFAGLRDTWFGFRLEREGSYFYGALHFQLLADLYLPDGSFVQTDIPNVWLLGGLMETEANTPLSFIAAPEPSRSLLLLFSVISILHRRRRVLGSG